MTREHPIENLMKSTMESIRDMVDVNTIIGDAVETRDGTYIIPISKVSFGFASGGSEFDSENKFSNNSDETSYPFGGGSGAGVSVKPVAFLVVRENSVRLLPVEQNTTYDRIVDTVPQIIEILKDAFNSTMGDKECKNGKHSFENSTSNKIDDSYFTSNCNGHDIK